MNDRFFERAGGLAIVAVLVIACLKIIAPFLGPMLWGAIIAISTWPLFDRLQRQLGGRQGFAAFILTTGLILVFVVPIFLLVYSLTEHVASVSGLIKDLTTMTLPPAPAWLVDAPLIGPRIDAFWQQASTDMPALLETARPALKDGMTWLLKQSGNLTLSLFEFLLAIVLAGFLCANGAGTQELLKRLICRVAGETGLELIAIAGQTVRAVSVGVVGTALMQALLSVFGFAIAGIPGAGLLGLFCFILAMLQVGTALVWIPAAVWLSYQGETGWAVFTVGWSIFINIADNFVKPYLISHGSGLPIPLIFLGVLGGLLAWGFVGIFVGATLLVVCFTLLKSWLDLEQAIDPVDTGDSKEHA
ncbi:AI-2E family transporter [Methylobacter sp. Wu8]|uniref:AI-2E family transporter n=1 Tax=Methylobacter sp. Wu8 TaxID=3118457 RepID=UPI002F33E752